MLTHGPKLVFALLLKSCFFYLKVWNPQIVGKVNLVNHAVKRKGSHLSPQQEKFFLWGNFFQTFINITWWIVKKAVCRKVRIAIVTNCENWYAKTSNFAFVDTSDVSLYLQNCCFLSMDLAKWASQPENELWCIFCAIEVTFPHD